MAEQEPTRRPLASRNTRWAGAAARWLAKVGLRPNQISVLSLGFASFAGMALIGAGSVSGAWRGILFLLAAGLIQLRLLCNLFDGMVAVEGGFKTKSGEIYNELPDRVADVVILAGAGYAMASSPWLQTLGWMAAALAVITAYVRALGASVGTPQYFLGPMAKPHRMATLTVACVLMAVLVFIGRPFDLLQPALIIICLGCLVTIARRVVRIVQELESK
jgi:phosphatidylglycerophosphate synthase